MFFSSRTISLSCRKFLQKLGKLCRRSTGLCFIHNIMEPSLSRCLRTLQNLLQNISEHQLLYCKHLAWWWVWRGWKCWKGEIWPETGMIVPCWALLLKLVMWYAAIMWQQDLVDDCRGDKKPCWWCLLLQLLSTPCCSELIVRPLLGGKTTLIIIGQALTKKR